MKSKYMIKRRGPYEPGKPFHGPANVTFNYQAERKGFSIWYEGPVDAHDPQDTEMYMIVPTGATFDDSWVLQSTVIVEGFYAFHLLRYSSQVGLQRAERLRQQKTYERGALGT